MLANKDSDIKEAAEAAAIMWRYDPVKERIKARADYEARQRRIEYQLKQGTEAKKEAAEERKLRGEAEKLAAEAQKETAEEKKLRAEAQKEASEQKKRADGEAKHVADLKAEVAELKRQLSEYRK